jgi:hypothetical protein
VAPGKYRSITVATVEYPNSKLVGVMESPVSTQRAVRDDKHKSIVTV